MYRITKPFKYSSNGYEVEFFEPDEYADLSPEVIRYARSIGAIDGDIDDPIDDADTLKTCPESDHGQEESQEKDGPAVCRDPNITKPAGPKKKGRKH